MFVDTKEQEAMTTTVPIDRAPAEPVEAWRTLLRGAADMIDKVGWVRGTQEDAYGHLCIEGALGKMMLKMRAEDERLDVHQVFSDAHAAISSRIDGQSPSGWNDTVCQSADEAMALLRDAAAIGGGQ